MTDVYFVRHCQSQKGWKQKDSIRPLTALGKEDSAKVKEALHEIHLDYCACSNYIRSIETIRSCAEDHGLEINPDPRFGERIGGKDDSAEILYLRWQDHDYCEEGGECINSCQRRNIEGLHELLAAHEGESILFGTHGTALCTIINYYEPDFGYEDFQRFFGWMPYIIHTVFCGTKLVSREDLLVVDCGY